MFVITGGGSGIGRALAQALASREKSVLIIGRREEMLAQTAARFPLISTLCADIACNEGRDILVNRLQTVPSLEGLIHNAGTIEPIGPVSSISESAWQNVLATNLNAPLFLTQRLLGKLQNARVLHIGSGAAYFPIKGWSAYCVSKAALAMLTRCWQLEMDNPAFASVMPGIIDTDMQTIIRQAASMDKEKLQFFIDLKNKNQLLSPDTVALFLSWLLIDCDKTRYSAQEWDIYDKTHHAAWLPSSHQVPDWESV